MTVSKITSRSNELVKQARPVRDGRVPDLIFVEGVRLCEEAADAGLNIETVFYTEDLVEQGRGSLLLKALAGKSKRNVLVSDDVIGSISDTDTPQGIVLLASRPGSRLEAVKGGPSSVPLIVVLHRVNNPSNAGAVIRTAEAAGATGVVLTSGSADPFSPKALRGAMGSSFRLPVVTGADLQDLSSWLHKREIQTLSASQRSDRIYTEVDMRGPCAVVLGAEASGLSDEEAAATDASVRIPMRSPVDSLNVSVAAAILLYEAARQRM
jgi:TrmH family RNA methyltransferase